jgi:hypothetical protein
MVAGRPFEEGAVDERAERKTNGSSDDKNDDGASSAPSHLAKPRVKNRSM